MQKRLIVVLRDDTLSGDRQATINAILGIKHVEHVVTGSAPPPQWRVVATWVALGLSVVALVVSVVAVLLRFA